MNTAANPAIARDAAIADRHVAAARRVIAWATEHHMSRNWAGYVSQGRASIPPFMPNQREKEAALRDAARRTRSHALRAIREARRAPGAWAPGDALYEAGRALAYAERYAALVG